jgi:hypothetical protein
MPALVAGIHVLNGTQPMHSRVIATIGLHGSASTWVFNVARELTAAAFGEPNVVSLYTEKVSDLPQDVLQSGRHVVIKSHSGSAELDAWLDSIRAKIFLSIRDPRDASISMSQRFKAPLKTAAGWVASDCRRLMKRGSGFPLLRYEERFFDDVATVERMADHLGFELNSAVIKSILAGYSTDAVRSLAQKITDAGSSPDAATQIHRGHIGDARCGKWRDLPRQIQIELTQQFEPFLAQFGYY